MVIKGQTRVRPTDICLYQGALVKSDPKCASACCIELIIHQTKKNAFIRNSCAERYSCRPPTRRNMMRMHTQPCRCYWSTPVHWTDYVFTTSSVSNRGFLFVFFFFYDVNEVRLSFVLLLSKWIDLARPQNAQLDFTRSSKSSLTMLCISNEIKFGEQIIQSSFTHSIFMTTCIYVSRVELRLSWMSA